MKVDLSVTAARERALAAALKVAAALKRVRWLRTALGGAVRRLVHVSVGVRTPLRSLEAYRFVPLGRLHGPGSVLPRGPWPPGDVVFVASLGRHALAILDGATGALRIRRAAAGLGLEERLRACRLAAGGGVSTEDGSVFG
jgi:hypothetical protein